MAKNPARTTPAKNPDDMMLNGSNTLPAQIDIAEGQSVLLGDVVALAFKKSGLLPEAWNDLPEAERDIAVNQMIEQMKAAAAEVVSDLKEKQAELPHPLDNVTISASPSLTDAAQMLFSDRGPRARQEIRYRGKTYAPGEYLPADIDAKTLDELDDYDAI